MAIASSSDWSFACINCGRKNYKFSIISTCKIVPLLSLPSPNFRSLLSNSSGCPSPILHDSLPVTELDLKLLDSQHSLIPDADNLNDLLCGLFKDPRTEEVAYKYYEKAKEKPEFRPEKSTINLVIRYLIRSKKWSSISSISEDFKNFHVLPDSSTCSSLVSSCIKTRKFRIVETLLKVFESDGKIAVLAFDTAMRGYNKLHMYSSTIAVYERMRSAQIVLDSGCYCRIMEAYMKIGDSERVVALFQEFQSRKLDATMYSSQIYGIFCVSLGKLGRAFEALEFFRGMIKKGILEDSSIYASLICTFASIREVKVAEDLFREAEEKKKLRDPTVFLKLVLMYFEEGAVEKTLEVVKAMKGAKIGVSDCIFCAIVNGYSKRRGLKDATKVYEELILQGCEPGQVTYASIINVYCRLGLYSKAEMLFSEMEQKGYDKCVVAYSSIVVMFGKTGRLRDAMRLVAKMKERGCKPNVWIYNSLMDMHGRVKDLRQVEKLWKEMKRRKVVPDKVSYTSVISAYSKAREFETCVRFYNEFRINGGVLDRAMAGIMVGVFSKINRIDELIKLLQDMKLEGMRLDGRLYRSSLNALRDAGLQMQTKWLQESFEVS